MAGKFEIKKNNKGQFMFNLRAANNQIILTSEMYSSKSGAQGGIESVKNNSRSDASYERKSGKGKSYFVLKATNGQVIGTSEMYSSASSMEAGIASVKTNAPKAAVDDLTV